MAKKKVAEPELKRFPRAITPEAREAQIVAAAVNLVEKQILEGTVKSTVLVHYLKLASTKAQLEKELLETQVELNKAKTEAAKSAKRVEDLYAEALNAMRQYSGQDDEDDDDY